MRWLPQVAVSLLGFVLSIPAALASADSVPKISPDWFDESELHAPHWKVTLGPVSLLYSQRFVVHASALLPSRLKKGDRDTDWHIILRVADENGKWFDGLDYTHLEWRRVPARIDNVIWSTDVLARPGNYQLVVLAYDAESEKHFLWRKLIRVEKPDILPDLDRNLPQVEFINPSTWFRIPVGEHLPIRNSKPVRIDVVLNLTGELQLGLHNDIFSRIRQRYVEGTLQGATGVFSQLRPSSGCVRLSAIDILHVSTALDRASPDTEFDEQSVYRAIASNRDTSKVDVRTLTGRTKARDFFQRFIGQVIADDSGCGEESAHNVERVIVVVSDAITFPKGPDAVLTEFPSLPGARFFHVKISIRTMPTYDQVRKMLDPLNPRKFDVTSPKELRRAVAEIIKDIEGLPGANRAGE